MTKHDNEHECKSDLNDELPSGWCSDWNLRYDAIITIKYVDSSLKLEDVAAKVDVTNMVWLYRDGVPTLDTETITVNPVIQKSKLENGRFTITFNAGKYDLTKYKEIRIEDRMSENLFYQYGSIQIIAEDNEGFSRTLTYGKDYTLEVLKDLHRLRQTKTE